jgi:hypothetical protein
VSGSNEREKAAEPSRRGVVDEHGWGLAHGVYRVSRQKRRRGQATLALLLLAEFIANLSKGAHVIEVMSEHLSQIQVIAEFLVGSQARLNLLEQSGEFSQVALQQCIS